MKEEENINDIQDEGPQDEEMQEDASVEESFREAIAKQAVEEDVPLSSHHTLRKILGGDILTAQVIRRQLWVLVLIGFFTIVYITNRYNVQKDLIEIDKLQKELKDAKFKALSSSSQITEKSRESHVLDMLKNNKDSILQIPNQPPFIINVPENEQIRP